MQGSELTQRWEAMARGAAPLPLHCPNASSYTSSQSFTSYLPFPPCTVILPKFNPEPPKHSCALLTQQHLHSVTQKPTAKCFTWIVPTCALLRPSSMGERWGFPTAVHLLSFSRGFHTYHISYCKCAPPGECGRRC